MSTDAPIQYLVRMPQPHNHRFEVEALFPAGGETLTVALPVWTPGSYLVREFSRHLQRVSAETEDGAPLPVTRVDKRSFRVWAKGAAVRFRYSVYANELTVRTSHLDGTHGFFNGANVFLYDDGRRSLPHLVRVEAPEGWRAFTALPEVDGAFVARDYDELVDSPFEIGPHQPLRFDAAGAPHEVVIWGEPQPDAARLVDDLRRIVETEAAMMGGLPHRRYLFILHLADKGRGGLEHHASCALLYPRFGLTTPRGWEDFDNLCAHEYFHLWNIKRIRPRALMPFDYGQENYTRLLWAFEGGTSYYDMLVTRRAGLVPVSRYLMRLGETLTTLHGIPGRKVMTLEEASLQAWIKHYRPDENSPNSAISYYLKGELVAWLLDLEIRRATKDQRSLDDVMRLLWDRYGKEERGVPEDGVEAAACEVAGADLTPFFDRALRSTEELDYSVLEHVGLKVNLRARESAGDKGGTPPRASGGAKPKGYLGANARPSGTLSVVYDESPAQQAGLYPDDEVIALDGFKVDGNALQSRCEDKSPGDTATLTVFRRDKLLEVTVTLGARPEDAVYLTRVEAPTDAQKSAFAAWSGASWEEN